MKTAILSFALLLCAAAANAETVTARYYGSEIDLSRENNPCLGNTAGGVAVDVVTEINSLGNNPERSVVKRTYRLPDGETLKCTVEVVDAPKYEVLHRLFPRQYPKIKG